MGKLTSKGRAGLRTSQFALPGKRAYPVEDRGHAEEAIHVAGIQHARGKLSEAQEKTVDAKAEHVLHAANGGFMEKPKGLRRDASNVSKNFTRKSQANLRPVKMADGGPVDAATIAKQAGFPMTPPNPAINPTVVASTPQPGNPHTEPMHTTTIGVRGANGGHVSIRHAMRAGATGAVRGPGGPTADKVPAMLSNGEYVLPAKTVAHIGRDNLDNLVRSTNDGHEPGMQPQHFADGGEADGIPKLTDPAPASAVPGQGLRVPAPNVAAEPSAAYRITPDTGVVPPGQNVVSRPNWIPGGRGAAPSAAAPEVDVTPGVGEGLREPYGGVRGNPNIEIPGVSVSPEAAEHIGRTSGFNTTPPGATAAASEAAPAAAAEAGVASKAKSLYDLRRLPVDAMKLVKQTRGLAGGAAGAGIISAAQTYGTPTEDFAKRLGVGEAGDSFLGDVGLRAAGAMQNLGNVITMGQADRLGNLIGGNGYRSSDDVRPNLRQPVAPASRPAATAAATPQPVNTDVSSNESNGLEMQPDTNPALPNAPGSAGVTGVDANGIRTIGYDGSPGSRDAAMARYEDAAAHPQFDPSHVYSHDADGNLIDEGRGDSPSYQARYNEARARALDPAYSEAGIQAMHNAVDAKYGDPSEDVAAAGLRGGATTWSQKFANARMMATRMAMAKMAVEERNNQRTAQVAMAGHQLSADATNTGHVLTAQAANARLAQEQAEHQRTFDAEQRRLYGDGGSDGGSEGRANDEAKAKGDAQVRDKVAAMIQPGPDGKPDTARAAQLATSLNALIAQRVQGTQEYLKANPGDQNARAWLARYQGKGAHQLNDSDLRDLVVGNEADRIAQEHNHPILRPFGTAVVNDAPITSLRFQHHTFTPNMYVSNRGDKIPAYAIDKTGSFMGLGGQINQNFNGLRR